MSKSDYYRPADYQIDYVWKCSACGAEIEQVSLYDVGKCRCGGMMQKVGIGTGRARRVRRSA